MLAAAALLDILVINRLGAAASRLYQCSTLACVISAINGVTCDFRLPADFRLIDCYDHNKFSKHLCKPRGHQRSQGTSVSRPLGDVNSWKPPKNTQIIGVENKIVIDYPGVIRNFWSNTILLTNFCKTTINSG